MKHIKYRFVDSTESIEGVARCFSTYLQLLDDLQRLDADIEVYFAGALVSRADAIDLVTARIDEEDARFRSTRKEIWVHTGATNCRNTWHRKLVRK